MHKILVINPGSTSTKIAVYDECTPLFVKSIRHEAESAEHPAMADQLGFRKNLILKALKEEKCPLETMAAVIGRGGLLRPLKGGTYRVNEAMLEDMRACRFGEHASNLGAILADLLVREAGLDIPTYIADPVVVDELIPEARYSGWPEFERISIFHALNQKAVAKRYAREQGKKYDEIKVIVAHMGGGITVGCHLHGQVIDVNNGLDGEGPFSAERTGTLPLRNVMDICYSGRYTRKELQRQFIGKGGLYAYLGTKDGLEIEGRIEKGDEKAIMAIRAMAYQVAKEIGALATVLTGEVDAILVTGGLAYLKPLVNEIERRVKFIAPVKLYPGEDEMGALALAATEVLKGEAKVLEY